MLLRWLFLTSLIIGGAGFYSSYLICSEAEITVAERETPEQRQQREKAAEEKAAEEATRKAEERQRQQEARAGKPPVAPEGQRLPPAQAGEGPRAESGRTPTEAAPPPTIPTVTKPSTSETGITVAQPEEVQTPMQVLKNEWNELVESSMAPEGLSSKQFTQTALDIINRAGSQQLGSSPQQQLDVFEAMTDFLKLDKPEGIQPPPLRSTMMSTLSAWAPTWMTQAVETVTEAFRQGVLSGTDYNKIYSSLQSRIVPALRQELSAMPQYTAQDLEKEQDSRTYYTQELDRLERYKDLTDYYDFTSPALVNRIQRITDYLKNPAELPALPEDILAILRNQFEKIPQDITELSTPEEIQALQTLKDINDRLTNYNLAELLPADAPALADRVALLKKTGLDDVIKRAKDTLANPKGTSEEQLKQLQDLRAELDAAQDIDPALHEVAQQVDKALVARTLAARLSRLEAAISKNNDAAAQIALEVTIKYVKTAFDYSQKPTAQERATLLERQRNALDAIQKSAAKKYDELMERPRPLNVYEDAFMRDYERLIERIKQIDQFVQPAAKNELGPAVDFPLDAELKLYLLLPQDRLGALQDYAKTMYQPQEGEILTEEQQAEMKKRAGQMADLFEYSPYQEDLLQEDGKALYFFTLELLEAKPSEDFINNLSSWRVIAGIADEAATFASTPVTIKDASTSLWRRMTLTVRSVLSSISQALLDATTITRYGVSQVMKWVIVPATSITTGIVVTHFTGPLIGAVAAGLTGAGMEALAQLVRPSADVLADLNERRHLRIGVGASKDGLFTWAIKAGARMIGKAAVGAAVGKVKAGLDAAGISRVAEDVVKSTIAQAGKTWLQSIIERVSKALDGASNNIAFQTDLNGTQYKIAQHEFAQAKVAYARALGVPTNAREPLVRAAIKAKQEKLQNDRTGLEAFKTQSANLIGAGKNLAQAHRSYIEVLLNSMNDAVNKPLEDLAKPLLDIEAKMQKGQAPSFAEGLSQMSDVAQSQIVALKTMLDELPKQEKKITEAVNTSSLSGIGDEYIQLMRDFINGNLQLTVVDYVKGLQKVAAEAPQAPPITQPSTGALAG